MEENRGKQQDVESGNTGKPEDGTGAGEGSTDGSDEQATRPAPNPNTQSAPDIPPPPVEEEEDDGQLVPNVQPTPDTPQSTPAAQPAPGTEPVSDAKPVPVEGTAEASGNSHIPGTDVGPIPVESAANAGGSEEATKPKQPEPTETSRREFVLTFPGEREFFASCAAEAGERVPGTGGRPCSRQGTGNGQERTTAQKSDPAPKAGNPPVLVKDGTVVGGEGSEFHTGEWPEPDEEVSRRLADTSSVPGGETAWFANGEKELKRTADEKTAATAQEQKEINEMARIAAMEADEFQKGLTGHIRVRTWLAIMALLGLTATAAFLTGKNWTELFPEPQRPISARFAPDPEQISTFEKDLEEAKRKIAELLKQTETQARLIAADDKLLEDLRDVVKTEVAIDDIPIAGCGEGHYCGIDAKAMQDSLKKEGWTLAQVTPAGGGKGPTYLFHRMTQDGKTELMRLYGWEVSPLLRADEAMPGATVSVRGEKWVEQATIL